MSRLRPWAVGLLAAACLLAGVPSSAAAGPASAPPQPHDYCGGHCDDIMPPGQAGNFMLTDIVANQTLGIKPPHTDDQTAPYANLADDYKKLTEDSISRYFNDSAPGVPANQVASVSSPRSDVKVVRDKSAGIPHIYGSTRAGTEFGAGYVAGQDRLWVMDLERHLGRGDVTSFAGGSAANRDLEQTQWRQAPYSEADLQAQIDQVDKYGKPGKQALEDAKSYLAGVNAYIAHANATRTFPGTYDLTGHPLGAKPFTLTDLVAIAGVVGAQFGSGGGNEIVNAVAKQAFEQRYGTAQGDALWASFRAENDPEAVTTVHDGHSFPYGGSPANATGVTLPDAGSLSTQPIAFDPTGSAAGGQQVASPAQQAKAPAGAPSGVEKLRGSANGGAAPGMFAGARKAMSNALLVSAKYAQGGHPIAVMGAQTGYFEPQPLLIEELQGPGISARGAAFAGLSMYVELGRGQDYSWSATSGEQDDTDVYAVPLCDPSGKAPTKDSTSYQYHGQCLPMQPVEHDDSWCPNFIDQTGCGSYKLITYRTKYGLVTHRGTAGGKPVAFASLRSTYRHEINSVIGFEQFNDPSAVHSPETFQQAASNVNYAFNWFYTDSAHIAYYGAGADPVRPATADPDLPQAAVPANEWKNWNPDTNEAQYLSFAQHPHTIDQDYIVSWNNKRAPGYAAGPAGEGPVQRGNVIDDGVRKLISGGHKASRADLTKVMENSAGVDTRTAYVLPDLLRVIDTAPVTDPTEASAVAALRAWQKSGSRRQESAPGSKTYDNADAIRIMDAWWSRLASAEFQPGLGDTAYQAMAKAAPIDNPPYLGVNHQGSVFFYGWYGYTSKDVRGVLGDTVSAPLPRKFCGGGSVAACRTALLDSLKAATAVSKDTLYPGDGVCKAGDQWCADTIHPTSWGGINSAPISWQNRPTFQQTVQYQSHR